MDLTQEILKIVVDAEIVDLPKLDISGLEANQIYIAGQLNMKMRIDCVIRNKYKLWNSYIKDYPMRKEE